MGLSPLTMGVLASRMPAGETDRWLRPDLGVVLDHNPHQMRGMDVTIERLRRALRDRERIFVVTDYDVDGTTSSLILQHALHLAGGGSASLAWHIPDRFDEGYGFRPVAADKARDLGCSLVITADIGVRDHDAVDRARSLGLDVLICDHHLPAGAAVPPNATSVLCPPQVGCDYPNAALAACGVSLKVAQALLATHPRRDTLLRSFLKLAAIGTVADVVDLSTTENRAIVALGMAELARGPHSPGLAALMAVSGLNTGRALTARDLGFALGPRINAAGRLEKATDVVELLNEKDPARALERAQALNTVNSERQGLQKELEAAATAQIPNPLPAFVVVWGDEDRENGSPWHRGIAGIVAARIRESVLRPVAVVTVSGGTARGSIRSVDGVHAVDALDSVSDLLDRYGGHPAAAGFTLNAAHLPQFAARLDEWARNNNVHTRTPEHIFDIAVQAEEVSLATARELATLGPFGKGNPTPVLCIEGVRVSNVSTMGSERNHLKFRAHGRTAVWWRGAVHAPLFQANRPVDLLVHLEENHGNGRVELQIVVEDARYSEGVA